MKVAKKNANRNHANGARRQCPVRTTQTNRGWSANQKCEVRSATGVGSAVECVVAEVDKTTNAGVLFSVRRRRTTAVICEPEPGMATVRW